MLADLKRDLEIKLRLLDGQDNLRVKKWLQDPYIIDLTFVVPGPDKQASLPFSEEIMKQYLEALITDRSRKTFAIEAGLEHVGNIGLKEIDLERKKAELFIEIGEAEYRGLGIGKASMAILLDYVFAVIGLEEMILEVLEFNQAALRVYRQLGFEISHRSGWHYDPRGHYWQVWLMRLPKQRWFFTRNQLILPGNLLVKPLK